MDIKKLKLDRFKNIQVVNFPKDVDLGITSTKKNVSVIIYYIQQITDLQRCIKLADSTSLPKENRIILVYEKGRKDGVNRDSIIGPFKTGKVKGFKFKPPTPLRQIERMRTEQGIITKRYATSWLRRWHAGEHALLHISFGNPQ